MSLNFLLIFPTEAMAVNVMANISEMNFTKKWGEWGLIDLDL